MSTDIPRFAPENYPRTYKSNPRMAPLFYAVIAASLLAALATSTSSSLAAAFIATTVVVMAWTVRDKSKRLTLERDALEYATLLTKRRIRRDEIKGVQCNARNLRGSYPNETIFISKAKDVKPIHVPHSLKVDEFYDAWVAKLPFLGGTCEGHPVKEGEAHYNAALHAWEPGGQKVMTEIIASSNAMESKKPGLAISERQRLQRKDFARRQLRFAAIMAFFLTGMLGVMGLLLRDGSMLTLAFASLLLGTVLKLASGPAKTD